VHSFCTKIYTNGGNLIHISLCQLEALHFSNIIYVHFSYYQIPEVKFSALVKNEQITKNINNKLTSICRPPAYPGLNTLWGQQQDDEISSCPESIKRQQMLV
jgi:hypothetical protein